MRGVWSLNLSTGGEVANAQVCKTCIRGFETRPVLQSSDPDDRFWPGAKAPRIKAPRIQERKRRAQDR